jgi:hypothetical protein
MSPTWPFVFTLTTKLLMHLSPLPMHAKCQAHLSILYLIPVIFCEKYKLQDPKLCNQASWNSGFKFVTTLIHKCFKFTQNNIRFTLSETWSWWPWQWGETTSLNFVRQRAYYSSPKRHISMENRGVMILTGENSWLAHQS